MTTDVPMKLLNPSRALCDTLCPPVPPWKDELLSSAISEALEPVQHLEQATRLEQGFSADGSVMVNDI